MKTLALSPAAEADLERIWEYSAEHWGMKQADLYIDYPKRLPGSCFQRHSRTPRHCAFPLCCRNPYDPGDATSERHACHPHDANHATAARDVERHEIGQFDTAPRFMRSKRRAPGLPAFRGRQLLALLPEPEEQPLTVPLRASFNGPAYKGFKVTQGEAKMRILVSAISAFALAGCATAYGEMGFSGGVAAERMSADTFRIKSRANHFTDKTVAADYALLQAAEAVAAACYTHFRIVNSDNRTTTSSWISPSSSTSNWSSSYNGGRRSGSLSTTYTPGQEFTFVQPGVDLYIQGVNPSAGYGSSPDLFSAQEVMTYTGSRVTRSKRQVVHQQACASTPQVAALAAPAGLLPPPDIEPRASAPVAQRPVAPLPVQAFAPSAPVSQAAPLAVYPRISPVPIDAPQPGYPPQAQSSAGSDDVWVETPQGWRPARGQ